MKRAVLDQLARDHRLSRDAIDAALGLTGSRPGAEAWRAFGVRLLNACGVAAVGAGAIFFIAANWQYLGAIGRFVPVEAALIACVAVAWWRPPPSAIGTSALVLAILVTGALLALFGQTYQTGADVFELFFAWAAVALPFALAARSGAAWATWWIVLDVGLALYCGFLGTNHFFWAWLERGGVGKPVMLLAAGAVNLGGAALFAHLARTRFAGHAPRWIVRMLTAIGFLYGTAAAIMEIKAPGGVVLAFAAFSAVVATLALRSRKDVFPMALVIGSWIAISTALLIVNLKFRDVGGVFVVAGWLIATSSAAGFVLMRWVREWRFEDAEEMPEATT